jgi:hypothetical protein
MRWISKIAVATMCVVFVTPHSSAMARCSFSPYEFFRTEMITFESSFRQTRRVFATTLSGKDLDIISRP